jgi:hypothetical protein
MASGALNDYVEFDAIEVIDETEATGAYTAAASAVLSKDSTSPQAGEQWLKVAYNGSAGANAYQSILTIGKTYRARGYAKGDGTFRPQVTTNAAPYTLWDGTSSTSWQVFDFVFVATGTSFNLKSTATAAGHAGFDSVEVIDESEATVEWNSANAILSKETGSPHEGEQWLKIYATGSNPRASQSILTVGKTYRIKGVGRGDGTLTPRIYSNVPFTLLWSGSSSTSWQAFDFTFVTTGTDLWFFVLGGTGGFVGFDAVTITEIYTDNSLLHDGYMNRELTLVVDGDCEDVATTAWTTTNISLSKEVSYYKGKQCLRLTYSSSAIGNCKQEILSGGKEYRIKGAARSDGTAIPSLLDSGVNLWTGTNSTDWQEFDITFTSYSASGFGYLYLQASGMSASDYVEFDDLELTLNESNLLEDGDMEASGVTAWSANNDAILEKNLIPYDGLQCLRITYNGTSNPNASQSILVIGKSYKITGYARGDGSSSPRVYTQTPGSTQIWAGTTSVSWQYFEETFTTTNSDLSLWCNASGSGFVEFDDVTVAPIGEVMTWTTGVDAFEGRLSKQISDITDSTTLLRIMGDAIFTGSSASQWPFRVGQIYRIRGLSRGDGTMNPRIFNNTEVLWTGTTSTSWQYFDETFIATHERFILGSAGLGATKYVEYDKVHIEKVANLLPDGDMEKVNAEDWLFYGATPTKETSSPKIGTQNLKITYDATTNPYVYQEVLIPGKTYRIFGWFRGDGGSVVAKVNYGTVEITASTTSNAWQYFDETFTTSSAELRLRAIASAAGYAEFDGVVLTLVNEDYLDWVSLGDALLSKVSNDVAEGDKCIRIAYNGTSNPYTKQDVLVVGRRYKLTGKARGDGIAAPRISASGTVWDGTTSAIWQDIDIEFIPTSTGLRLYAITTASSHVEFDNLTLKDLGFVKSWLPGNDAVLVKNVLEDNTQSLKIEYDGTSAPYAYQDALVNGIEYRVVGRARSDGVKKPSMKAGSTIWTGIVSTSWQYFDITFTSTSTIFELNSDATSSGYVEFDNITMVLVNPILSDGDMEDGDGPEVLIDGNMEASGTSAWTAYDSVLSKEANEPPEGNQWLKITAQGSLTGIRAPSAIQHGILTIGKYYKVTGWSRSDGIRFPIVYNSGGGLSLSLSNDVEWEYFETHFIATSASIHFLFNKLNPDGTEFIGFDDVSIFETCPAWTPGNEAILTKEINLAANSVAINHLEFPNSSVWENYIVSTRMKATHEVGGTDFRWGLYLYQSYESVSGGYWATLDASKNEVSLGYGNDVPGVTVNTLTDFGFRLIENVYYGVRVEIQRIFVDSEQYIVLSLFIDGNKIATWTDPAKVIRGRVAFFNYDVDLTIDDIEVALMPIVSETIDINS